jgi:hypothetical protein
MKGLIDAAFLHVEGLGNHVTEGHYDIINGDGKIVLPEVYEQLVKPGSKISQHMWPLPAPSHFPRRPGIPAGPPGPPPTNNFNLPPGPPPMPRGPAGNSIGPGGPPVIVNLTKGPPAPAARSGHARGVLGWMAGTKSDDSSFLAEDSDIEDEPEDLGLEIDFDKEDENAKLNLGDLLAKFTNATDTVHDFFSDDEDSSDDDSGSGGSSSYVSD